MFGYRKVLWKACIGEDSHWFIVEGSGYKKSCVGGFYKRKFFLFLVECLVTEGQIPATDLTGKQ